MQELLAELLAAEESPKITLQIPAGEEPKERSLRLRHQLEAVTPALEAHGVAGPSQAATVQKAKELATDPTIATARRGTAGVYVAGDFWRAVVWPAELSERTYVNEEFYLADIVDLVDSAHCYVLTLSRGGAHLFRADALNVSEVPLDGVPSSLAESTAHLDPERQLQFHQSQPTGRTGTAAMFHGHGIGEGRGVEELRSYLRAIDRGVRAAVAESPGPLALVGSDELPAHYRSVSALTDIIDEVDRKHPEGVPDDEVRQLAESVLQQRRQQRAAAARSRIHDLVGAGKASVNLQAIVGAALHGRVETLLVGPDYERNDTAVNRAVVGTLRHRGQVLADGALAGDAPLAALLRY